MTESIIERLCMIEPKYDNLFWNHESSQSHPLRKFLMQSRKHDDLIEKHIHALSATQKSDRDFFWQEVGRSNLLALLYMDKRKNVEALQQLELTLEHAPNNLNAMVGKIRILEQQCHNREAREMKHTYEKLNEDAKEMERQRIICQGEIAYACSFVGPEFYMSAIDRYEDLLRSNTDALTISDHPLHPYVIQWHYYLAYTYNRMLNKGHTQKLTEKLDTTDTKAIFQKISEVYLKVVENDNPFYKGKAMVDLVDVFKKCETLVTKTSVSGGPRPTELRFPYDYGPDKYVKLAMETAPDDAHVLERCGRHYRQKACSTKDFEAAIKIFDHLTELHPERHVAWHHKGFACRALWHIVGKYEEARLYTNSAKRGNKKGVKKRNHRDTRKQPPRDNDTATKVHSNSSLASSPATSQDARNALSLSTSVDESTTSVRDSSHNMKVRLPPLSAPTELPTLPARNRQPIGEVPRQLRKPDFFDTLRTSNPPFKDDKSGEFLRRAEECFEKAKDIAKGTCSPYIVDLARCYISLDKHAEAEREFQLANGLSSSMNANDAAYLYEQWALMKHSLVDEGEGTLDAERNDQLLTDVAPLYRKALLSTVRAREKSRMAFYKLRDLLFDLKDQPGNEILALEYEVLRNSSYATENSSECKAMLVEALKKEETRDKCWKMIELLNERRHKRDAATAFVYLTALHEAKVLDVGVTSENRQHLLDVAWRLSSEEDLTSANCGHTFGEVFRWIVGSRHISEFIDLQDISKFSSIEKSEICVLAPKDDTPGVDAVNRVLQLCGIEVAKAYCEGNCDILLGCYILPGLRAVVATSQSVVVIEDSTDAKNWEKLRPTLEELMTLKQVNVCLVANEDVDFSETESHYVNYWSRVIIRQECSDLELAHKLLTTLLCKQKTMCA